MIIVVSYASGETDSIHIQNQKDLDITIKRITNYRHVMYNDSMIQEFIKKNKNIFKFKKGAGYWSWKPYIIKLEMDKMEDNDILLYIDSGSYLLNPIEQIIKEFQHNIITFNSCCDTKILTKRDCLILMDADTEEIRNTKQIEANFIILRKKAIDLVNEWLLHATNEQLITDSKSILKNEHPEFSQHRHDQSILDILAKKYPRNKTLSFSYKNKYVMHHRRRAIYTPPFIRWGCFGPHGFPRS